MEDWTPPDTDDFSGYNFTIGPICIGDETWIIRNDTNSTEVEPDARQS